MRQLGRPATWLDRARAWNILGRRGFGRLVPHVVHTEVVIDRGWRLDFRWVRNGEVYKVHVLARLDAPMDVVMIAGFQVVVFDLEQLKRSLGPG